MHNEPSANSGHGIPLPLNHIHILCHQSTPIRFALIEGQPWFVAADVCKAVGVYNPRHGAAKYVRAVADSQKALVKLPDIPRGSPAVLMISQSGLDKLLWLALHSVSAAWPVLSSITAQASFIVAKEAA
ncbi:Bro-N domain-containing protein [Ensifer sp. YR511]|uniref:BRO-N domain-containing protein n=1 Tax=Ensifer sp. YR511 TaxID=1855294 RepID=UPI00088B99F8|nr:Bro-N domain-containing protein [Ensifer sp. YR511]SDM28848.1 BRO family, N-terminal domain [Ensifer sp. YR511]